MCAGEEVGNRAVPDEARGEEKVPAAIGESGDAEKLVEGEEATDGSDWVEGKEREKGQGEGWKEQAEEVFENNDEEGC